MFFKGKGNPGTEINFADYGKEVVEAYEGIRSLRHDMGSYLRVMNALAKAGRFHELSEYLNELCGEFHDLAAVSLSGNAAVDALLAVKMKEASAAGFHMRAHVVLPYKTGLSPYEWTTMLSNLLTNAIEACAEIKGAADAPYIKLDITFKQGMLHIEAENASAGVYKRRGETFLSTKGNGRGLGLKRVASVVKAHGGYMVNDTGAGFFTTQIILPLEE